MSTETRFSAADGTSIRERRWALPEGAPARGTVLLVHGFGEHIGRYDHVAAVLNESGFHVLGSDLRGHGESGGPRGYCARIDDYLSDLATLAARGRESGLSGPLFVLGHSFGGLLATRLVLTRTELAAGLVLSSPFFQLALPVPTPKLIAGRLMSHVWPTMALPTGLAGKDVSRDPEVQRAYDADPLNLKKATVRWFTEAERAQTEALARAHEIMIPCLIAHGGADHVASPDGSRAVFARLGCKDKTLEILPDCYHEIFNEPERDRTHALTLVARWLVAHAAS
jgi:lysophospholipase